MKSLWLIAMLPLILAMGPCAVQTRDSVRNQSIKVTCKQCTDLDVEQTEDSNIGKHQEASVPK